MRRGTRAGKRPLDIVHGISLLDGETFLLCDERGDISQPGNLGLYHADTRYLSKWHLTIAGRRPDVLTSRAVDYFSGAFFLTNPGLGEVEQQTLSIVRLRTLIGGLHEELTITNHNNEPVDLELRLAYGSDFADLFEVKAQDFSRKRKIAIDRTNSGTRVSLTYQRDGFFRRTTISFSLPGKLRDDEAQFKLRLEPKQEWELEIAIDLATRENLTRTPLAHRIFEESQSEMEKALKTWDDSVPQLRTDHDDLYHEYERSCIDLAALRLRTRHKPPFELDNRVPAAGLPWFMALFGRDTIIASYQAMICTPQLSATVLHSLSRHQGQVRRADTDEEPGKILHELRHGELATFREEPYYPSFASVDSTLLFIILLSEYYRWTGDTETVLRLKDNCLRALDWMTEFGDKDRDGYIEYYASAAGLRNQGWKDSHDAIQFADGRQASTPIALCEVQGYAYDAQRRAAELCRLWEDEDKAATLEQHAEALKQRFNRDFWIDQRGGYFALGLDATKRQIDSKTSNMGQLLWSGIVDESKAPHVVKQLFSPEMFTGWGIRTMSSEEAGYSPIAYHRGTVWPHDNSLICAGLRRYGFDEEAARLAQAIMEAGKSFDHRLPEAFAGYRRGRLSFPVRYPTSSRPQAWSSGAIMQILRTLLGIETDPQGHSLTCNPIFFDNFSRMELSGIHAFGRSFSVHARSGGSTRVVEE